MHLSLAGSRLGAISYPTLLHAPRTISRVDNPAFFNSMQSRAGLLVSAEAALTVTLFGSSGGVLGFALPPELAASVVSHATLDNSAGLVKVVACGRVVQL